MTKRKNYSRDFRAKVALEAVCIDLVMMELSKAIWFLLGAE